MITWTVIADWMHRRLPSTLIPTPLMLIALGFAHSFPCPKIKYLFCHYIISFIILTACCSCGHSPYVACHHRVLGYPLILFPDHSVEPEQISTKVSYARCNSHVPSAMRGRKELAVETVTKCLFILILLLFALLTFTKLSAESDEERFNLTSS